MARFGLQQLKVLTIYNELYYTLLVKSYTDITASINRKAIESSYKREYKRVIREYKESKGE